MRKKNTLISLIAAGALSLTAIAVCSLQPVSGYAETTTVESEFIIQEGASVRFATNAETQEGKAVSGIRFAAYITETYYQTLTQTTYPTATEIVLQSTVSKVVEESEAAPTPFTYSWNLKNPITFNDQGVATFYHTLNFNSLTGENLKAANAFDLEADFWIEVKTESAAEPIKIEADNAGEVDTVRSMRQVAYTAYTTPGTEEKPNNAYQDNRLKNYFTLGESKEALYDSALASTSILELAPESVEANKAYLVDESGESAIADVTKKTLSGDTGVFTALEGRNSTIKTIVYFDENNVAYPTKTRFVTKIVDNETELINALKLKATTTATVKPLGYHLLSTDITISEPLTTSKARLLYNGWIDGDGHKITVSYADTFRGGLFGTSLNNINVKNLEIEVTRDFGTATQYPEEYQAILGSRATNGNAGSFTNVSVNVKRASGDDTQTRIESNKYNLLLLTNSYAKAENVVVHVDGGVLKRADESDGLPFIVSGFKASTSCYVFASNVSANGTNYNLYKDVADAVEKGEKFLTVRSSGYFTFDETNKTLTFGKTDKIDDYDVATDVIITQTSVVDAVTDYATFRNIGEAKYLVPGLVEGLIPQGMDVWDEKKLLFVTGYFKEGYNTSKSPSSLMVVVDLKTGKHVGTYCIKTQTGSYYTGHFGGIAITEKNIFIPGSGKSLYRIPLSQVEAVMTSQTEEVKKATLTIVEQIYIPVGPSYINYSNGVLWVGKWLNTASGSDTEAWEHMTNNDGATYYAGGVGYKLKDTESEFSKENWNASTMSYATPDYYLSTCERIQGFTFVGDKIVLSKSGGTSSSSLIVYENVLENEADTSVTLNGKEVPVWFLDSGVQVKSYSAPPKSEGVCSYNDKLLVLFESAATYYIETEKQSNRTDYVWSLTLSE